MNDTLDSTLDPRSTEPQCCPPFLAVTTYFAPPGRDSHAEICHKATVIDAVPLLTQTLDAMPEMVMVLNSNRQVVTANKKLLANIGCDHAGPG